MIKVLIHNSFSKLEGPLAQEIKLQIDKVTSFPIASKTYYMTTRDWLSYEHLFNFETQMFPTGLVPEVVSVLDAHKIPWEATDLRQVPAESYFPQLHTPLPPLRPYQKRTIDKALVLHRGVREAPTGTGKGIEILHLAYELKRPVLIIVPTVNIADQTYDRFCKYFKKEDLGLIYGGKSKIAPITIALPVSLSNCAEDVFNRFDAVMWDEFHHAACETITRMNYSQMNHIYFRFGFTATPFRTDGADLAMRAILGNYLDRYSIAEAINDKALVKPIFRVYNFSSRAGCEERTYRGEYKYALVDNSAYQRAIVHVASKLQEQKKQTIIFVDEIAHGRALAKALNASFICGEFLSEDNKKTLELFNQKKISLIIGTSVIGEGVDTVSAQFGILAGGGKSPVDVIQKIGRLLRPCPGKDYACVIDFCHTYTKYLFKHARMRAKIYTRYGTPIEYAELPQSVFGRPPPPVRYVTASI